MIRGLYASASGMITGEQRQALIAHDIANVNSAGYKQAGQFPTLAPELDLHRLTAVGAPSTGPVVGQAGTGVYPSPLEIDFSQGPLLVTGRELDVALEGEGFFQVQTPDGRRFTRDGRFRRDADGNLVTAQGYFVLDANGQPIQLPQQGDLVIARDGTITVDEQPSGQLGLVEMPLASLQRAGDSLFLSSETAPAPATDVVVRQGYVEGSNVDAAATMIEMLLVARTYQANQRLVQLQDQVLARTMDIGRVA